jgi:hypothetical protein
MVNRRKKKKEPCVMMDVEILDPIGYEICRNIAKSNLAEKFYLAGGTALALQLCHRKSYDLDFFLKEVNERIEFEYIYNILTKLFPRKDERCKYYYKAN